MSTVMTMQGSLLARFGVFIGAVHPLPPYLLVATLWPLSLLFTLVAQGEAAAWQALDWRFPLLVASCWLMSLYFRCVDEIKDLDYDRVHNPDRPLITGAVSSRDVILLGAPCAGTVVAMSGIMGASMALYALVNMGYALFLFGLERVWRRFRESIVLNLALTFPVSAMLNGYVYLYLWEAGLAPSLTVAAPVFAAFIIAALHFEFGRKLKWPAQVAPGENVYAVVWGGKGSAAVCAAFGAVAAALMVYVHMHAKVAALTPLLALVALLALAPSLLGIRRFLARPDQAVAMKPWFALFLLSFHGLNVALAVLGSFIAV